MKNPFDELKQSKTKVITLAVYAAICLLAALIGGWYALGVVFVIPGALILFFCAWSLLPEFGAIWTSVIIFCAGAGIFILVDCDRFDDARKNMEKCDMYLDHSVCLRRQEALYMMDNFKATDDPIKLHSFLSNRPHSGMVPEIRDKYDHLCSLYYSDAEEENTIQSWEKYKKRVPKEKWADADSRIEQLQAKAREESERAWKKESTAWEMARAMNNSYGYEKYLNLYPRGAHAKAAIDAQVSGIMSGEHGSLPSMDRTGYGSGSSSSVSVSNDTQYTLTLLYSGSNDSKRLVLAPHASGSLTLRNGTYRIAASVNAGNVSSYAGTEDLSGGSYSVSYYISTYSVPRRY